MLGAVVPFVRTRHSFVLKLVSHCLPGIAAVIGSLHHLTKPAGVLGGVEAIRVNRRTFNMVDLPARKMGPAYFPMFTLPVSAQDKSSLSGTNQHSYSAHIVFR